MKCFSPIRLKRQGRFLDVPCGRCAACLTNKRNSWYFRLRQEYISKGGIFVTLTYDDEHIEPHRYTKLGNCRSPDFTLSKRDLQLFFKNFRHAYKKPFTYYLVGEYGTHFLRPHYHLLLFGISYTLDNIRLLERFWYHGNIDVANLNEASINYVCLYHTLSRADKYHHQQTNEEFQPEFTLMSKGIGKSYITDIAEEYHASNNPLVRIYDVSMRMPRYYRKKIYGEQEIAPIIPDDLTTLTIPEMEWFTKNFNRKTKNNRKL